MPASNRFAIPVMTFTILLMSCGDAVSKKDRIPENNEPPTIKASTKDTPVSTERPPVINITDTVGAKKWVILIKDSAATFDRIALKLGLIYGVKLPPVLKKGKLKPTGAPMAWYKTSKAPYFFEAGIAVDKRPTALPKGVLMKELAADSVTIAHFYGPYHLLSQAYDVLKDMQQQKHRKPTSPAYEVYIDDPMEKDGKLKDPYRVLTDVIQPWH